MSSAADARAVREHAAALELGEDAPPWHHNPSSWRQRVPICALAAVGFAAAFYMALCQWGAIDDVWDPVFGEQSRRVLDSDVSSDMRRWFGVPDAALGAIAYLGDVVFGLAGSTRRWQYRPWLVLLFGIDVIPLGVVSAILVGMQGTVVGAYCFLCLATAVISLLLIVLAYDEVWSSIVYLRRVWDRHRDARTLWRRFWGVAPARAVASSTTEPSSARAHGIGSMWARDFEIALGVWLVGSQFLFGRSGSGLLQAVACAGLIVLFATISHARRARRAHLASLLPATWLVVHGWLIAQDGATSASQNDLLVGLTLAMLAIVPSESNRPPLGWRRVTAG